MKKLILLVVLCLLFPTLVLARVGVGVSIGKTELNEPLKAGGIYPLPPFNVFNTGDEPGQYGVRISFHSNQPELRPVKEWFNFNPETFYLEPGKTQIIETKLNLPIKVPPGKYFAYIEAFPKVTGKAGETTIGIAAAGRLYFTVEPANIWQGIYYKILALWQGYKPWTYIVTIVISLAAIIIFLRRFLNFKISVGRKRK